MSEDKVFPLTKKVVIDVLLERRKPLSLDFIERLEAFDAESFKKIYVDYLKDYLYEEAVEEINKRKAVKSDERKNV